MVTAAVAALIGCTTFAVAQETGKGEPGKGAAPSHAATPSTTPSHGATPNTTSHSATPSQDHSAQGASHDNEHGNPSTAQGTPKTDTGKSGTSTKSAEDNAQGSPKTDTGKSGAGTKTTEDKAQTEERTRTRDNAQTEQGRGHGNAQTEEHPRTPDTAKTGNGHDNATAGKAGGSAPKVELSEQQRTKVKDIIVRDRSAPRIAHADFSVHVGVTVPRTVHVAVLPTEIVEIVPEYRGFDYVLVGDELLIIDPHTLEIVYILPA
jgi:hypothetical protein